MHCAPIFAVFGPLFAVLSLASAASAQEIVVVGRDPTGFKASTLDADALQNIGAQAPSEALNRIAGVNIQRNNGLENLPAIRSPVLTGGQSAGSFLVLEDGVPIRAPGFANVNQIWETSLDFAGAVTVVRGPGGAAYGSNAVHGLIDVETPGVGPFGQEKRYALEVGGFGRVAATVALPWSDRGVVSMGGDEVVAIGYEMMPPRWYLGLHAETDAAWRSESGLDRQALLLRRDDVWGDWTITGTLVAQNLNQETASFIEGDRAYTNRTLARGNPTPEAYRDTRLARARLTLERGLGDGWSLSVTPFARAIEADLNLSFFPSRAQEITRQTGGGVQLRVENTAWLLGFDVDRTRGTLFEFQTRSTIGTFTQGLHYDFAVDMTTAAAFAESQLRLRDDLRLIAGLRAEWITYDYDNRAPTGDVGRFRRVADRSDDFSALTPKLGFVWGEEEGQVYANAARGARAPQITDLYALQTTQTPGGQGVETIDSLEIGWRGFPFGVTLDVSAYHMDKRDSSFRNSDGFTVTRAATRHQGLDVSFDAPLGESFGLAGWASLARHTYQFSDAASRAGESIRKGDDIDTAPRVMGNLRARWEPSEDVQLELEWTHMGAYFTNAANTRRYPGHDVFGLRAHWDMTPTVRISGHVRNLFDEAYAERADFAFGQDRFFPGEPRNVTLRLAITD